MPARPAPSLESQLLSSSYPFPVFWPASRTPWPDRNALDSERTVRESNKALDTINERIGNLFRGNFIALENRSVFNVGAKYYVPKNIYNEVVWKQIVARYSPVLQAAARAFKKPSLVDEGITAAATYIMRGFYPILLPPKHWNLAHFKASPQDIAQVQAVYDAENVKDQTKEQIKNAVTALKEDQQQLEKLIDRLGLAQDVVAFVRRTTLSITTSLLTLGISDVVILIRSAAVRINKMFEDQQRRFDQINDAYAKLPPGPQREAFLNDLRQRYGHPPMRALFELSRSTLASLFFVKPLSCPPLEQVLPKMSYDEAMRHESTKDIVENKQRNIFASFALGIFEEVDTFWKHATGETAMAKAGLIGFSGLGSVDNLPKDEPQVNRWVAGILGAGLALQAVPSAGKLFSLARQTVFKNPKVALFAIPIICLIYAFAVGAALIAAYFGEKAVYASAQMTAKIDQQIKNEQQKRMLVRIGLVAAVAALGLYFFWWRRRKRQ